MSSAKATQTYTKYYLYNPLTHEKSEEEYETFGDAVDAMRDPNRRGVWEVHSCGATRKRKK